MTADERKKLVELYNRELTPKERYHFIDEEEAGRGLGKPMSSEERKSLEKLYFGNPYDYFDGKPSYIHHMTPEELQEAIADEEARLGIPPHATEVA